MLQAPEPPPVEPLRYDTPWGRTLYYVGAPLQDGPLPTLFYFSLSGEDSLATSPFNQPVAYLQSAPLRIFSLDLPAHKKEENPHEAIKKWAEEMAAGRSPLVDFIDECVEAIQHLIKRGIVDESCIGTAGLSRGAFFATHLAARLPAIRAVLGFAPLVDLAFAKDFAPIATQDAVQELALINLIPSLIKTHLRFYIGNRDTLVSTKLSFEFITALADAAYETHQRPPAAELIITSSIGHHGHGTRREIFLDGAEWIKSELLG